MLPVGVYPIPRSSLLPGRPRVPWLGPGMYATVLQDERPFMGMVADPRGVLPEQRVDERDQQEQEGWAVFETRRSQRNRVRGKGRHGTYILRSGGGCAGAQTGGGGNGRGGFHENGCGGEVYAVGERLDRPVKMAMWRCVGCGRNSFVERTRCFGCGRGRTAAAVLVEETWREDMLPRDISQRYGRERGAGGASHAGLGQRTMGGDQGRENGRNRRVEEGGLERTGGKADWGHGRFGRLDHVHTGKGGELLGGGNLAHGKGQLQAAEQRSTGPGAREVGVGYDARSRGKAGDGGNVVGPAPVQVGACRGATAPGCTSDGNAQARPGGTEMRGPAAREPHGGKGPAPAVHTGPIGGARAKAAPSTPRGKQEEGVRGVDNVPTMQVGKGKGNKIPVPFVPPELPRDVLVAREQALLRRIGDLEEKNPEDPRLEVARVALGTARKEVRCAGGHTPQKICFSLLETNKQIAKCKEEIVRGESRIQAAKEKVAIAVAEQVREEEADRANRELLQSCHQRAAYLGFQAAVEGGKWVGGYAELAESASYVEASYLAGSAGGNENKRLGRHIGNLSRFVRQFGPAQYEYDEADDPVLQELASGRNSSHSISVDTVRVGSNTSVVSSSDTVVVDWREEEAYGEEEAIRQDNQGVATAGQGDEHAAECALEKVRAAAASAVVSIQLREAAAGAARGEHLLPLAWDVAAGAAKIPVPNTVLDLPRTAKEVRKASTEKRERGRSRSKEGRGRVGTGAGSASCGNRERRRARSIAICDGSVGGL